MEHKTDTDAVLPLIMSVGAHEASEVASKWPDLLKNMVVVSIRPARLNRCMERLGPLGEFVRQVVGVDGNKLDIEAMLKSGKLEYINQWNTLTPGEVGCFLAHRKAWQFVVDNNWDFGFILEDDVDLRPSYQTLGAIQEAKIEEQKFDILFIARDPKFCRILTKIPVPNPHLVWAGKTWGLQAYVVSREAASKLLAKTEKIIGYAVDLFVSCSSCVPRRLAITPIPFHCVQEGSDTQPSKDIVPSVSPSLTF